MEILARVINLTIIIIKKNLRVGEAGLSRSQPRKTYLKTREKPEKTLKARQRRKKTRSGAAGRPRLFIQNSSNLGILSLAGSLK